MFWKTDPCFEGKTKTLRIFFMNLGQPLFCLQVNENFLYYLTVKGKLMHSMYCFPAFVFFHNF